MVMRFVCAAVLTFVLTSSAHAQTAPKKFLRGLAGMTAAFLEVPGNMAHETDLRGAPTGLPLGFAKGCGMIVPRVLVGVFEFLTAPFPIPEGYDPILEPEYPWSYFESSAPPSKRRR